VRDLLLRSAGASAGYLTVSESSRWRSGEAIAVFFAIAQCFGALARSSSVR